MTIANLITLMRVFLVPVIVWAMLSEQMLFAFSVFILAGLSDAVDGAVARYFNQQSEFGTVLDPIADKIMLVSVFIVLTYMGQFPLWLTILIVSRDVLIICGVMLALILVQSVIIKPIWVSKANTFSQIVLAALVLGFLAFEIDWPNIQLFLELFTGLLTAASAVAYVAQGLLVFSTPEDTARFDSNHMAAKKSDSAINKAVPKNEA